MASDAKEKFVDWGGLNIKCKSVRQGWDSPGGTESNVKTLSGATTLDRDNYTGRTIALGATGAAVTLPAATGSGARFRFVVSATVTSGSWTIVAAGSDYFEGLIYQVDTDTGDALVAYPAVVGDTYQTITLNGSTTGGLIGDVIEIEDVASAAWALVGHTRGTGTVATPLS